MTGAQLYYSHFCLNTCGAQESINSGLVCTSQSPVMPGMVYPASAQPHALLLTHVGAHKEGFQLSFPLDVDESSTLAGVAQLLQHAGRFLCDLEVEKTTHDAQLQQKSIFVLFNRFKTTSGDPSETTQSKIHCEDFPAAY